MQHHLCCVAVTHGGIAAFRIHMHPLGQLLFRHLPAATRTLCRLNPRVFNSAHCVPAISALHPLILNRLAGAVTRISWFRQDFCATDLPGFSTAPFAGLVIFLTASSSDTKKQALPIVPRILRDCSEREDSLVIEDEAGAALPERFDGRTVSGIGTADPRSQSLWPLCPTNCPIVNAILCAGYQ